MFRRLADGIFAIGGSASASQFPELYQQYLQRLGGRLDQAEIQEQRIIDAAHAHGLSARDYAETLGASNEALARSAGTNLSDALNDADQLRQSFHALASASPAERPIVFSQYVDQSVLEATLSQFTPAVPLSMEGLIYAAIGMGLGLILLAGCEKASKKAGNRIRKGRSGKQLS